MRKMLLEFSYLIAVNENLHTWVGNNLAGHYFLLRDLIPVNFFK